MLWLQGFGFTSSLSPGGILLRACPNLAMAEARNTHMCKVYTDEGHRPSTHFLASALGLQSQMPTAGASRSRK